MDLRYCAQCGEAFLVSKGLCMRCENGKSSVQNTGVKTAFLLGLLSLGAPSQGAAEPPKEQASEKQSEAARVSSTFAIAFAANETPIEEFVQGIGTVVQSQLSTIEDLHKQHKSDVIASTFSLQVQLINGAVTKAKVLVSPDSAAPNVDSDAFLKAIEKDASKWVFPKEITKQVIISFSINTNRLPSLEVFGSNLGPSKPGAGSGALYGVPQSEGFGGLGLKPHASVSPKYGVPSVSLNTPRLRSKPKLRIVEIVPLGENDKATPIKADINRIFRKYMSTVTSCHLREMGLAGEISGDLVFGLIIHKGKLISAKVKSNSTGSDRLAACVQRKIQIFKFPSSYHAQVEVKYSLEAVLR